MSSSSSGYGSSVVVIFFDFVPLAFSLLLLAVTALFLLLDFFLEQFPLNIAFGGEAHICVEDLPLFISHALGLVLAGGHVLIGRF